MKEKVIPLFDSLDKTRILMSSNVQMIYNILSQIYNVLYPFMDGDMRKEQNKLEKDVLEELISFKKKRKHSFFVTKSNIWERSLRSFAHDKIKEDEFSPGGI